jgi:thiol-disulfide isomerase/thioredoxin
MFLRFVWKTTAVAVLAVALCGVSAAQTAPKNGNTKGKAALPKITRIDIEGLKPLLKPNGKPLLINFWATWCDPCREEFPDLVKISDEFGGRVDFVTVSLDDLADIDTDVPKFLREMNSKMAAYLLHTPDESAAISMVSKDWTGNLPMTVLFDARGILTYQRNGKIFPEPLREKIRSLLPEEKTAAK